MLVRFVRFLFGFGVLFPPLIKNKGQQELLKDILLEIPHEFSLLVASLLSSGRAGLTKADSPAPGCSILGAAGSQATHHSSAKPGSKRFFRFFAFCLSVGLSLSIYI